MKDKLNEKITKAIENNQYDLARILLNSAGAGPDSFAIAREVNEEHNVVDSGILGPVQTEGYKRIDSFVKAAEEKYRDRALQPQINSGASLSSSAQNMTTTPVVEQIKSTDNSISQATSNVSNSSSAAMMDSLDDNSPLLTTKPKARRAGPPKSVPVRDDVKVVELLQEEGRPKGTKFGVAVPMGDGPGGFDQSVIDLARANKEARLAREAANAGAGSSEQKASELDQRLARQQARIAAGEVKGVTRDDESKGVSAPPMTELQKKLLARKERDGEGLSK